MKYLLLILVVFLSACQSPTDIAVEKQWERKRLDRAMAKQDQCMVREIFMECLAKAPAGPQAAKYNDWDEMVSECRNSAIQFSQRPPEEVDPKCSEM